MPKSVPPGLLDPGRVRCMAIKVVRRDGVVFGLTDSNLAFVYQGVTYRPVGGVTASAIQSDAGTSAGSLTFKTLEGLQDAVGVSITATDLRNGRYQGAQAWVYELDPTDPALGAITHNRYVFSKATIRDADKDVELRESLYRLKNATGRTLESACDVGCVFDRRCDPSQALKGLYSFSRSVADVPSIWTMDFAGDDRPDGYYSFGYLEWTAGNNAGLRDEIKLHQALPGDVARITLKTPREWVPVLPGDVAILVRGCDRSETNCQAIVNPHNPSGTNVENRQAFRLPIPDDVSRIGRQSKS